MVLGGVTEKRWGENRRRIEFERLREKKKDGETEGRIQIEIEIRESLR